MKKALLFLLFIFCIFFSYYGRFQPVSLELVKPSLKEVEIKGEVQNPGVYTVKWEATVQDVIEEAGGMTKTADDRSINLLMKPEPESTILIPGEKQTKDLISINEADKELLCELTGIGPVMAQRIIDYRQNQPFTFLEQLMEVKGIGEKTFQKLKDDICL